MESSYHSPAGTVCLEYISDDLRGGEVPRVSLSFLDDGSNLLGVRVIPPFSEGCWDRQVLVLQQTWKGHGGTPWSFSPPSLSMVSHSITALLNSSAPSVRLFSWVLFGFRGTPPLLLSFQCSSPPTTSFWISLLMFEPPKTLNWLHAVNQS